MAKSKRLLILTESEIYGLYERPQFAVEQQRFFFALNDQEKDIINQLRSRKYRCMAIALLGYFKSKPVILEPNYKEMQADLQFIADTHYDSLKLSRFSVNRMQKARIYAKILSLTGYSSWNTEDHNSELLNYLAEQVRAWASPRHLFDAAIEYMSSQGISIPAYSTLQKIISQVVNQEQNQLIDQVDQLISPDLRQVIFDIVNGDGSLALRQLRQSARNFTGTELEKELVAHRHLQPWMPEITSVLNTLSLSQKNQQHFAERVDYYGAKLKRQAAGNQQLFLLCYLQFRWQQALERIADGFVHHIRQTKQKAKAYAQEAVYQDWQKAAKNVSKAAEVLHLFIDDNIDHQQPFGMIKEQALKLLAAKDLESVYLFLNEQKRSVDESMWQYYDQKEGLRKGLLRELFLCLRFEGSEGTQRLTVTLEQSRLDFSANGAPAYAIKEA